MPCQGEKVQVKEKTWNFGQEMINTLSLDFFVPIFLGKPSPLILWFGLSSGNGGDIESRLRFFMAVNVKELFRSIIRIQKKSQPLVDYWCLKNLSIIQLSFTLLIQFFFFIKKISFLLHLYAMLEICFLIIKTNIYCWRQTHWRYRRLKRQHSTCIHTPQNCSIDGKYFEHKFAVQCTWVPRVSKG